jgi:DNA repair protein RadD
MQLRPYQQACVSETFRWFRDNASGAPVAVLPTGAGKSLVLAEVARKVVQSRPENRVLVVAHRAELLEQNAQKIRQLWPDGSIGLYSAGLKASDLNCRVTVAGVQSIYKRAEDLGPQTLVIIDEVHRVDTDNDDTQYRRLLDDLLRLNPKTRIFGLSATPFRTGRGSIVDADGLFVDVCFEAHMMDLINQGYLSRLVSKCSKVHADLSEVAVRTGEFVAEQMEAAFCRQSLVKAAVSEMIRHGHGRKCWLVFCAGVEHVELVVEELKSRGIDAEAVTGKTPPMERQWILERFRTGNLRCVVNCDVLTTGTDVPTIDLISVQRATQSPGLFSQMVGRGLRLAPGKTDCLILDHGQNFERHGPIDKIRLARRRNPLTQEIECEVHKAQGRACPVCESLVEFGDNQCPDCGYVWSREAVPDIEPQAFAGAVMSGDAPAAPERLEVLDVRYSRHEKPGKIPSMRVDYMLDMTNSRSEWVCFEHPGYAGDKAAKWWFQHGGISPAPRTVDEALARATGERELLAPSHITCKKDGRYWRILDTEYGKPSSVRERLAEIEAAERSLFEDSGVNI